MRVSFEVLVRVKTGISDEQAADVVAEALETAIDDLWPAGELETVGIVDVPNAPTVEVDAVGEAAGAEVPK